MVATNTLLSLRMMLYTALHLVGDMTPEDAAPFDAVAEFPCPSAALTLPIYQFADEFLRPAVDAALTDKHPKGWIRPFAEARPDDDAAATGGWEERGIFGRVRRFYDVNDDAMKMCIEILFRGAGD